MREREREQPKRTREAREADRQLCTHLSLSNIVRYMQVSASAPAHLCAHCCLNKQNTERNTPDCEQMCMLTLTYICLFLRASKHAWIACSDLPGKQDCNALPESEAQRSKQADSPMNDSAFALLSPLNSLGRWEEALQLKQLPKAGLQKLVPH